MPRICDRPLPAICYPGWDAFTPAPGSAYIFGGTAEERSHHPADWEASASDVLFVRVTRADRTEVRLAFDRGEKIVALRSTQLVEMLVELEKSLLYLDITGLRHHVWAPLVRAALLARKATKAVYAEPADYRFAESPTEGEIFDLSLRIEGISPMPGFISLTEAPTEEKVCFVPLLGFEGTRLAYVIEHVQPPKGKIVPIVGVPGFRPEYPFHTYLGNRNVLGTSLAWQRVKFAIANCPFSLFYRLEDIAAEYPDDLLKIALIGTKPHALGAVLFALRHKLVELVHDYPIPSPGRTSGVGNVWVYDISTLFGG